MKMRAYLSVASSPFVPLQRGKFVRVFKKNPLLGGGAAGGVGSAVKWKMRFSATSDVNPPLPLATPPRMGF